MSNQDGVTLIELVISLAVVMIFAGIVSLSLSSSDKRVIEEAASMLQDDLRYAQRMSVVEGKRYRVVFNLDNDYYDMFRKVDGTVGTYERIESVYFQEGVDLVSMNDPQKAIVYTPTGTTGDACTIVLAKESYTISLTVSVGSGRVAKKEIKIIP